MASSDYTFSCKNAQSKADECEFRCLISMQRLMLRRSDRTTFTSDKIIASAQKIMAPYTLEVPEVE